MSLEGLQACRPHQMRVLAEPEPALKRSSPAAVRAIECSLREQSKHCPGTTGIYGLLHQPTNQPSQSCGDGGAPSSLIYKNDRHLSLSLPLCESDISLLVSVPVASPIGWANGLILYFFYVFYFYLACSVCLMALPVPSHEKREHECQ